jgi:uncharacterized protein (DUF305 family)
MTRKSLAGMAFAVLATGAVLAGCGGGGHDMNNMGHPMPPANQQGDHNPADIAFAQQMIPHHAQALDMAKLVPTHTANPKVVDLAKRVQQAQDPEIQRMTGWLKAWGAPATSNMGDMPGHSMPGMNHDMPGMMDPDAMKQLDQAKDAGFDEMWVRMMIQHHKGAIDMAQVELDQGANGDAKAQARKIIDAQQGEITEMKGLLGRP